MVFEVDLYSMDKHTQFACLAVRCPGCKDGDSFGVKIKEVTHHKQTVSFKMQCRDGHQFVFEVYEHKGQTLAAFQQCETEAAHVSNAMGFFGPCECNKCKESRDE